MTRQDWAFFLALTAIATIAAFLILSLPKPAASADADICRPYSVDVERLVIELTNDVDISQAARDRAYVWCGVIDFPPRIKIEEQGTAPAVDKPAAKPVADPPSLSDWQKACAKRYRSFRASDNSVIPYHRKSRVPCPIPQK